MKKYDVKLIETYVFDFEVEAKNRVAAAQQQKWLFYQKEIL